MELIIGIYVAILSLFLGSFYNVVAIRLLKKESFIYPPSHCVKCQHKLNFFDLIPIFSYLFLRGRCRYCKGEISVLYPIGEAITFIVYLSLYIKVGFSLELIPALLFGTALILAFMTDIREKLILDSITFPMLICIGISRLFIGDYPYWYYILGSAIVFFLLWILSAVYKGGLGGGDIKLFALIGLTLGVEEVFIALMISALLGLISSIPLILKYGRKKEIAFAPYILIGSLSVYLYL